MLHTTTRGEGEPVLLLHSGGMSSRQWRRLAERLAGEGFRAIAPDFLGAGENPPWPDGAPFHFHQDVEAIEAMIAAPVHLIGHSYGGLVALTVARRRPEIVRSIAVYDPVAFGVLQEEAAPEEAAEMARVEAILGDETIGGGDAWMEAFVDWWNGAGSWRAMPAPSREAFLRVGRKVFLEVKSLMGDRTPASAYANVTAPALILSGAASPEPARRVGALLAAAMPRGRQLLVEGAGHMGPITHPAAVEEAILAHLR